MGYFLLRTPPLVVVVVVVVASDAYLWQINFVRHEKSRLQLDACGRRNCRLYEAQLAFT